MNSPASSSLLNILEVASPCTVAWNSMEGGDVVRFCSQCQLNVYNLSEMPAAAAETFLREHATAQRTCVRFFRRHDGTVITRDCPVGVAALKAKMKRAIVGSITVAASLVASMFTGCVRLADGTLENPATAIKQWIFPPRPTAIQGDVAPPTLGNGPAVMGQMCPPKLPTNDPAGPALQPPVTPASAK